MANLPLKARIVERFRIQGVAARLWKMSEPRLSRIITGLSEPTDEERKLFIRDLGKDYFESEGRQAE
jgi:hypothetical protein